MRIWHEHSAGLMLCQVAHPGDSAKSGAVSRPQLQAENVQRSIGCKITTARRLRRGDGKMLDRGAALLMQVKPETDTGWHLFLLGANCGFRFTARIATFGLFPFRAPDLR
jgi:hypothetical protein